MNPDDPKFTAHILGESEDLTPAERAEIEALLASDPGALAEADELRALASRLRAELPGEVAGTLEAEQRAAVLQAAATAADEVPAGKVIRFPRRATFLAAIAACVVVSATLALLYPGMQAEKEAVRKSLAVAEPNASVVSDASKAPTGQDLLASLSPPPAPLAPAAPSLALPPDFTEPSPVAPAAPMAEPSGQLAAITTTGTGLSVPLPTSTPVPLEISPSPAAPLVAAASSSTLAFKMPSPAQIAQETTIEEPHADRLRRQLDLQPISRSELKMAATSAPAKGLTAQAQVSDLEQTAALGGVRRGGAERSKDVPASYADTRSGNRAVDKAVRGDFAFEGEVVAPDPQSGVSFGEQTESPFLTARANPLSTFSIDVDTASYSMVRRLLNRNQVPPKGAVRIEELLNYFPYDYPQAQGDVPFSAAMEVAACPWAPEHRLVRIALKGREIARDKRPSSNLVFLIDVSGSMKPDNKLPLLKQSLGMLIDQLGEEDQVSIVVYAGNSGCVLEPTSDKRKMHAALGRLEAGGSTNGGSGIQLAYKLAEDHFIKGGTNRVILATDGDWNVGITSQPDLINMIKRKAKTGVFLTVLGVGMDNLKDAMLVKLADSGNGNYAYLDTVLEARKVLVEQLSGTLVTIAKDVKIQVEFNPTQVGAYRLIGYEKRLLAKQDFNDDKKDAGEIGAGHTVTALYEVVPAGQNLIAQQNPVDALKYQPEAPAKPAAPAPVPEQEDRPVKDPSVALEEAVRGGPAPAPAAKTSPSRGGPLPAEISKEMLTLKLRYKEPEGDTSKLLEFPLIDRGQGWEQSSKDFRFAAAVAGYGMLLRDSAHKGEATWSTVMEWAEEGKGPDASGYRAEFLGLLEKARSVCQ